MRTFGEIGVVKKSGKLSKITNKGFDGIFVGYEKETNGEVYHMYNLSTGNISCEETLNG